MNIDCVILVGGKGTRFKSISGDIPKPLVKINDKPLIEHIFDKVSNIKQVENIILVAKYEADLFKNIYDGKVYLGKKIKVINQKNSIGTASAVYQSVKHIKSKNFILMNGDTIVNIILPKNFEKKHKFHNFIYCNATTSDNDEASKVICDKNYILKDFVSQEKKLPTDLTLYYTGVAIINTSWIDKVFENTKIQKGETFENCVISNNEKEFKVLLCTEDFLDVGTPKRYHIALKKLK